MKKKDVCSLETTGFFVLQNNQCSPFPDRMKVKGIMVEKNLYLDIDSILKTPVSKQEALLYGRGMNLMLPTKKQMRLIEKNLEKINNSLLSIGRGDCLLLGAIIKDFWTRCEKSNNLPSERRFVLFLVPI